MLKVAQYKHFTLVLHVLTWSMVLFLPYLATNTGSIDTLPALYFPASGMVHIIVFYVNAMLLYPRLLNRRHWWLYVLFSILLVGFSVWAKFNMLVWWFPDALPDARSHVLFPSLLVFIVSNIYCITIDKTRAEKLQKENEAMQLGMELKFLRSQISPHFLFNILTSLVALARKRSNQLESSLLMLSGFMRYMLYDSGKKIALQQEVEYLESYISLQKLRHDHNANIVFRTDISEAATNCSIEPMLLIPFVENAFKHGTGGEEGTDIAISLTAGDGLLIFEVKNKYDPEGEESKDETSGIGLSNVQSRLSLLYPGRHHLLVRSDGSLFSIKLTIKLL